ncbi:unnamed protein product [Lampetra fluviatilis]
MVAGRRGCRQETREESDVKTAQGSEVWARFSEHPPTAELPPSRRGLRFKLGGLRAGGKLAAASVGCAIDVPTLCEMPAESLRPDDSAAPSFAAADRGRSSARIEDAV